ncbi:MAG: hypothetical protein SF187_07145 [Deltaproteobacteria bacterium]|nr:hypothetical protein [Deltaproteobacteria bacterium]
MTTRTQITKRTTSSNTTALQSCLLCEASLVKVPAWFTVAAAVKVAEAKRVDVILVDEPRRKSIARVADLKTGRPHELLARWVQHEEDAAAASTWAAAA